MFRTTALPLLATCCLTVACHPQEDSDTAQHYEVVADVQTTLSGKVDVLFVIDDSVSMTNAQHTVADRGLEVLGSLRDEDGHLLDIHVATVSTSVSSTMGDTEVDGCTNLANGLFGGSSCSEVDGNFMQLSENEAGEIVANVTGTPEDAFGCMVQFGTEGCGFEQPLEAMYLALDGTHNENSGFLREDATLAVIFVTDEDDCSASDPELFGYAEDVLGPLSSFRCFEQAVVCDAPLAPGPLSGCTIREDGLLHSLSRYWDFLEGIKAPGAIMIGTITGDTGDMAVAIGEMGNLRLAPSCSAEIGEASPAPRLTAFGQHFELHASFGTICDESMAGLGLAASSIEEIVQPSRCLVGLVADRSSEPGTQYECRATSQRRVGSSELEELSLPSCDSGTTPCYEIVQDPLCAGEVSGLRANFVGDVADRVLIECLRE